jgi:hypothetical protein
MHLESDIYINPISIEHEDPNLQVSTFDSICMNPISHEKNHVILDLNEIQF